MKALILLTAVLAPFALAPAPAFAADDLILVTAEEAALPPVPTGELGRRGVTRGPKVSLVSPASVTKQKSPIHLQLKFESYGGAKIDPNDVKVVYLKKPTVDLSQRVKPFTQSAGIDIGQAEIPPGDHNFRVDVKDSDGHVTTTLFTLNVVP